MASYPTYQPSIFVGRKDQKKLAPLLNPKVADADEPSWHQPRDRRVVSAGLDVQAGDRAGRDGGAPDHADRALPCSPDYKAYKQTFNNWTTLINQWIDLPTALADVVRHVLLRAR